MSNGASWDCRIDNGGVGGRVRAENNHVGLGDGGYNFRLSVCSWSIGSRSWVDPDGGLGNGGGQWVDCVCSCGWAHIGSCQDGACNNTF